MNNLTEELELKIITSYFEWCGKKGDKIMGIPHVAALYNVPMIEVWVLLFASKILKVKPYIIKDEIAKREKK